MLICDIKNAEYFRSNDKCVLCELLHPDKIKCSLHEKPLINYSLAHAIVPRGESSLPHRLKSSSEVYYIISGNGRMHIGDEIKEVLPGQAVYIPPGFIQFIENTGETDLIFLAIVSPKWDENDEEVITGKSKNV